MSRSVSRSLTSSVLGLRAAALIAAAVSATGCAQSVGDIDRTQPELIAKDHFKGQWFIRETMVDVPATSPASFIGEGGALETVVWDIQEDHLIGYRAYELVPGLDGNAESARARANFQPVSDSEGEGRDPNLYKGNPVVAYRIRGHVDVQRGYNPRTGEQNNIISENTTDRPWYERDYIRVDWSNNVVDNFLTEPQTFWPLFGEPTTLSSYVPRNEGGPDAFRLETDEDGNAAYIDFTARRMVLPSLRGCSAAMFNTGIGDCAAEELKVRTSMLKVDPEREQEYVPLVYDDRRQGEFGYFRVERPTYNRQLGNTFSGLIQLAGRHDIWEKSRDASGEPLPYEVRTLRPITYTLSENYPESMLEVTRQIQKDYDAAFKTVVAAARKQSVEDLTAELTSDENPEGCLFCLDENADSHARNGDLRYNFIYWVDDDQPVGPLGYGPSSQNPETGRTVSGNAYVYGAQVDRYAEYAKQIVELMIGEAQGGLSEEQIMSGQYFREAVRGELNPVDPRAAARFDGLTGPALSRAILGDAAFERMQTLTQLGTDALAPAVPGLDRARLQRIVGTDLEARMIPEEWTMPARTGVRSYLEERSAMLRERAEALGLPPPEEGPLGALTVTNWFGTDAVKELQEIEDMASRRNLWLAKFDDPAIASLARAVQDNGLSGEDLYQFLREQVFRAVMLHEIGHTVGLRHNFAGSADALNFHDEYWEHRVKSIEPVSQYMLTQTPAISAYLRSNCAVPGPLQTQAGDAVPGTDTTQACEEQRANGMAEYQYSTIMDYGGRFNADFHGLGKYDVAALGAGYVDLVEVFDESAMEAAAQASQALGLDLRQAALEANTIRTPILDQGLDNAIVFQQNGQMLSHYSNYPALFGGRENLAKRRFMPRSEYLSLLEQSNQLPPAERSRLPVKVPYLACYDEFVDSVETCHRWDQGADNYEIVSNNLTAYREYYVFNNFQRDRVGFDPVQVYFRTAQRYFLPLTNMYQHWFWGAAVTRLAQLGTPRGELGAFATQEGLFRLMNTMATPDFGPHQWDPVAGEYVPSATACPEVPAPALIPTPAVVPNEGVVGDVSLEGGGFIEMPSCLDIPRGVGRSFFSRYDTSNYDVFRRVLESGHFYDQMAALLALQQSNAAIVGIGSDVAADARQYRIPYNLVFPELIENLFGAIYNEQDEQYAMHISRPDSGSVGVVPLTSFGLTQEEMRALPVVAPGRTYTTRVQSLIAGMNLMDGFLNATFAKQGQISLLGSGEQRTPPEGFETVESTDPLTGRVFVAFRKVDNADGPWYAADLLEQANQVVEGGNEAEIARIFGDVELVRMAFNIFGQ